MKRDERRHDVRVRTGATFQVRSVAEPGAIQVKDPVAPIVKLPVTVHTLGVPVASNLRIPFTITFTILTGETLIVTVTPLLIVTSSPATGTIPPLQVPVEFQFPVVLAVRRVA